MEPIDPKIAKAIKDIRAKVTVLTRDAHNPHADYNYASIDTYYKRVMPLATEVGLIWRTRETKWELVEGMGRGKDRTYCKASFAFDLHVDGATAMDYMQCTVILPLEGAQTTGQLFSYADKVFMRVAFGIATGEKDADDNAPEITHSTPPTAKRPARFEDGDVPPGYDPLTGEKLPTPPPPPGTVEPTGNLIKDIPKVASSTSREGDPLFDTRKIDDKSVDLVVSIFRAWMPEIKTRERLLEWHTENMAALDKVAKINPAAREIIKGMFSEKNLQLKAGKGD